MYVLVRKNNKPLRMKRGGSLFIYSTEILAEVARKILERRFKTSLIIDELKYYSNK